ncbi:hypothetical protein WMY93_033089 [Mugilogobius chulae]|uniref:Uncharacterized protein n=1 Tax=Mugilogobius chulae TaxID=88201 RepID=A0AAW0MHV2_9GOBI
MESFYAETLALVTERLTEILRKLKDVKYILLVGGLSLSHILRRHVHREFGDRANVLSPKNSQEVIMSGALMFGRDPSVIRTRKSAFTYGVQTAVAFDPSKHRLDKRISSSTGDLCDQIFQKLIEENEDVKWDESREILFRPSESDQSALSFRSIRRRGRIPRTSTSGAWWVPWPSAWSTLPTSVKAEPSS